MRGERRSVELRDASHVSDLTARMFGRTRSSRMRACSCGNCKGPSHQCTKSFPLDASL